MRAPVREMLSAPRRDTGWSRTLSLGCAAALMLAAALPAAGAGGAAPRAAGPQRAIRGNWLVAARNGIVRITPAANGTLQGRIVGGTRPQRLDSKNPNPALRHDRLKGKLIMQGLKYRGDGRWGGGTIYDPNTGRTYRCRLQLIDAGHLRVRAYVGAPLFGRSQVWTRYLGTAMDLSGPV